MNDRKIEQSKESVFGLSQVHAKAIEILFYMKKKSVVSDLSMLKSKWFAKH